MDKTKKIQSLFFFKMQGLGNDFVLVDARADSGFPPIDDLPGLSRRICDRHFGVGADGLILMLNSDRADVGMRIFNPDGSEAEMCGNGIRCLARFARERGNVGQNPLQIETGSGIKIVTSLGKGDSPLRFTVDMGPPSFRAKDLGIGGDPQARRVGIPLEAGGRNFLATAVSMGNPHCVTEIEDLENIELETLGPLIEHHPLFPQRTNVEFVKVISPDHLKVRVWERGTGATLACGTGACAALAAMVELGRSAREAEVELPGGILHIHWLVEGSIMMTGPAEEVFRGEYPVGDYWSVKEAI